MLVIAIAVTGLLIGQKHAAQEVLGPLSTFVGPSGARFLTHLVTELSRPAPNIIAATVGLIALLFGASGAFAQLQDALSVVFDAKTERLGLGRRFVVRFLAFLMVLIIGLLLIAMQIFNAVLVNRTAVIGHSGGSPLASSAVESAGLIASIAVIGALFAALFHFVPGARLQWRDALAGGLFTAVLFVIGQWGVSVFIGLSALRSIHGVAAAGLIVLTWLYYSAAVVFFGAEFTRAYAHRRPQGELPALET